jgi:hypothetical protein
VEGEPESGPEQEAEVPAGDQACIGAAIQYRREFVGMVSEPLMDLFKGLPDLDALLVVNQCDRGNLVDQMILGMGGLPSQAFFSLHGTILGIPRSSRRA